MVIDQAVIFRGLEGVQELLERASEQQGAASNFLPEDNAADDPEEEIG